MEKVMLRIAGLSQARTIELLSGLAAQNSGIQVRRPDHSSALPMDTAVVAVLISSGAMILTKIVEKIVDIRLQEKKEAAELARREAARSERETREPTQREKPDPEVRVTVYLAMGGTERAVVRRAQDMEGFSKRLPEDSAEVSLIELE